MSNRLDCARQSRGQHGPTSSLRCLSSGANRQHAGTGTWKDFFTREAQIWAGISIFTIGAMAAYKFGYRDRLAVSVNNTIDRAKIAEDKGLYKQAIREYEDAIQSVNDNPFSQQSRFAVLFALGQCYEKAGMITQMQEAYKESLRLLGDTELGKDIPPEDRGTLADRNRVRRWKGIICERLGQIEQDNQSFNPALGYYIAALESFAGDPVVVEKIFQAHVNSEILAKQMLSTKNAVNIAGVLNNIAMLFLEIGEPANAKNVLDRCIAVSKTCVGPPDSQQPEFQALVAQAEKVRRDIANKTLPSSDEEPATDRLRSLQNALRNNPTGV